MDVFSQLAEERIKQALKDGEFDDIKGKGKPQKKDPLEHVPADLRMSYRIMKNSGYLPEEVQLNKELASLRDLLKLCKDDNDKQRIEKRISEKELQFQIMLEKRNMKQTSTYKRYSSKINRLF